MRDHDWTRRTNPAVGESASNRPISYVNVFNAARFTNWINNGQPLGAQGPTTTEDGAYTFNGEVSGNVVARIPARSTGSRQKTSGQGGVLLARIELQLWRLLDLCHA